MTDAANSEGPRLMRIIIASLWLLASTTAASAHDHGAGSWINTDKLKDLFTNSECCNDKDCIRVPDKDPA